MYKSVISKTYYFMSACLPFLQYDQEFQDKTRILFILTEKTKTREKFSRFSKRETIITEILYCHLALVSLSYFTSVSAALKSWKRLFKLKKPALIFNRFYFVLIHRKYIIAFFKKRLYFHRIHSC